MESTTTLAKGKKNLCTKYLLRSLEITSENFIPSTLKELGFVNMYLEIHVKDKKNDLLLNKSNCLYMIFNFDKAMESKFEVFIKQLKKGVPNFSGYQKIDECIYVLAFDVLPKWSFILDLFKVGKYSAFGKSYASAFIIGNNKDKKEPLEQYRVITRDPSYIQEKSEALGIDPSILSDIDLDEYPTKDDYIFYYKQTEVEHANIANNPYLLNIPKKLHGLSSLPKE
jgi:hypothetical protein